MSKTVMEGKKVTIGKNDCYAVQRYTIKSRNAR